MMKPPFYYIFQYMRTYDRNMGRKGIGANAYFALLKTLEKGIGFNSEDQLKQICTWLWRKPYHDKEDFTETLEAAFKKYYVFLELEGMEDKESERIRPKKRDTKEAKERVKPSDEKKGREAENQIAEKEEIKEPKASSQTSIIISFENARPDRDQASLAPDIEELEKEIFKSSFILEGNYFELGSRKLQQRMRALRKVKKSKNKQIIDLEETIEKAANQGFLDELAYQDGTILETDLILLIDHGDSMIAFEQFTEEIVNVTGLDFNLQNQVYYFSEAPLRYLFLDKEHKRGIPLSTLANGPKAPILIISDGGAATGTVETERVEAIVAFLQKMKHFKIAWLNPMPRHRWKRTAADFISYYVPMLDANALEFGNVIKLFKSKLRVKTIKL